MAFRRAHVPAPRHFKVYPIFLLPTAALNNYALQKIRVNRLTVGRPIVALLNSARTHASVALRSGLLSMGSVRMRLVPVESWEIG